jgi:hypothetical protein
MRKLQDMNLAGWTIIEHRADGENVVGRIDGRGMLNADNSLGLSWHHDDFRRTTVFVPSCWQCEIVAGVIFLKRIGKDLPEDDIYAPWPDASVYTLVRQAGL